MAAAAEVLVGFGFAVYGIYLGWWWNGTEYLIFFKAFILPVVLIVGAVRAYFDRRRAAAQTPQAPAQSPADLGAPTPPQTPPL